MCEIYRDPEMIVSQVTRWIKDRLLSANAKGGVLGLSGGLDSAVLAALLKIVCGKQYVMGVIMPCHSNAEDEADARLVAAALGLSITRVDLTEAYDTLCKGIVSGVGDLPPFSSINIKPRLRMTTLYAIAQSRGYLVCGASNKNELAYGYFTKHGDSGVDILPMGNLLKGEVRLLAQYLGIPDKIIEKAPSAGLFPGQTDEEEMGLTYSEMDRFLIGQSVTMAVSSKMREKEISTDHKRIFPPIAEIK